jgi:predicted nuclease of restriction endonuclease-like RecB superfamily
VLTSDLVRGRVKAGTLHPRYLAPKDWPRFLPMAESLVATFGAMVGEPKSELDQAVLAVPHGPRDRLVFLGLKKLCEDRLELAEASELSPPDVRATVFALAATAHRTGQPFDREAVLGDAAHKLGVAKELVEQALFADLREAQVARHWEPIAPRELLSGYNLSVAQAVLLRATRMTVRASDPRPQVWRAVFRSLRFHGLLHTIEQQPEGYVINVDGPFSMFDSIQKYGLRMGLFLKSALTLKGANIIAEVLWGQERTPLRFEVSAGDFGDGLLEPPPPPRPELEQLRVAFEALQSSWQVTPCEELLVARDGGALIPDLVFTQPKKKKLKVYLELFGFWSRAAIFNRIAQLQLGGLPPLILVAGKNLRVSEELVDESADLASLYMFKTTISAKEVLRRLEAVSG